MLDFIGLEAPTVIPMALSGAIAQVDNRIGLLERPSTLIPGIMMDPHSGPDFCTAVHCGAVTKLRSTMAIPR
ncbi:hypothetical protein OHB26_04085 [Nocardia sp. NBC_01503]|uniref:hypothetical protein n=1 Tax=Nocardia sp. NBC_01503 TaxID=2975997 RepID=UPI002E7C09CC|nr:hypothetical protein [Nocardia sp. NBC_01503]WTL33430.1 hypothetical protein OHB26_04085 [Nocardia sp. NBC_01503]